MTENEIIERLKALVKNGFPFCADALNLINHLKELDKKNENIIRLANKTIERQSAEIERLEKANETIAKLEYDLELAKIDLRAIKDDMSNVITMKVSEAIKEFAERLIKEALIESGFEVLQSGTIDNLVKEMVGDDNG